MDSAFLNLIRGNRLKLYAGINTDLYPEIVYAKDYTYAEFKAARILKDTKDGVQTTTKAKAGDEIDLIVNCGIVKPVKYKLSVEVTPELINCFKYLNYQRLMEEGDSGEIVISGKLRDGIDLDTLGGVARIYLLA